MYQRANLFCCLLQEIETTDDIYRRYNREDVHVTEEGSGIFVAMFDVEGVKIKKTRDGPHGCHEAAIALKVEILNVYRQLGLVLNSGKQIVIFLGKSALQILPLVITPVSHCMSVCPVFCYLLRKRMFICSKNSEK